MLGLATGSSPLAAYGELVARCRRGEISFATADAVLLDEYLGLSAGHPQAYRAFIPETLRDRPLRDPLVVEALESWASREAASIMVGLFLVAALVTVAAVPPGLALGGRTRQRSVVDDTPSRERDARMLAGDGNPDPGVIL